MWLKLIQIFASKDAIPKKNLKAKLIIKGEIVTKHIQKIWLLLHWLQELL
jgi:uncharacterized membrane protein YcaP (DUF421 family)